MQEGEGVSKQKEGGPARSTPRRGVRATTESGLGDDVMRGRPITATPKAPSRRCNWAEAAARTHHGDTGRGCCPFACAEPFAGASRRGRRDLASRSLTVPAVLGPFHIPPGDERASKHVVSKLHISAFGEFPENVTCKTRRIFVAKATKQKQNIRPGERNQQS